MLRLAALLLLLLAAAAAAQPISCRAEVEGRGARVWIDGEWRPLEPGPLPPGAAKIETARTHVAILCGDGLRVAVGIGTVVNMDALAAPPQPGGIWLQLMRGILGVIRPEGYGRPVRVGAGVVMAAARTTEWLVEREAEAAAVFVREGQVRVEVADAAVVLGPGEGVDVEGLVLGPVRRWGPPRVEAAAERLGGGWR